MCKAVLLITASLVFTIASSSSEFGEETCSEQHSLQSQLGLNLLQARRESSSTVYHTEKQTLAINPSGAAAPLDETGYAAVADRCCQVEMKVFIERQIFQLGMEVCEQPGLNGIVPYHSCGKGPQTFAALTENLLADAGGECPWLASTGDCKPKDPSCPEFSNVEPLPDCGCSVSEAVVLDFQGAEVKQNNLGGKGPDTGVTELRYQNIGQYPAGQSLDLVMTTSDRYEAKTNNNGKSGVSLKFGQIALGAKGNPAGFSGEIKLHLSFVRSGTSTPVVLPAFFFAVFDVDKQGENVMQTVAGSGYKGYVTDIHTDLVASKAANGGTKFTATQDAVPNPTDPMSATPAQRRSMVMYFYENISSFGLSLGVETSITNSNAEKWFNFAGNSALSDMCGP